MTRRDQGFALILVIWSLVLLTSIATGFAYAVRHETRVASDLADLARAEAAAAAALRYAVLAVTTGDAEERWAADAQTHEIPWPEATIEVRVRAESGRIDLNRAPRELLLGLFEQLLPEADHPALADAIIDWRDPDERPEPAGAEEMDYARAGYAYTPPNRPFVTVNELSQVMGFDDKTVAAVNPYLTIHSRRNRIHAASADLVVLTAVPGITRADAEEFIARREEALIAGDALDFGILSQGRRFLDTRPANKVFSLDIEVRLAEGFTRRQRAVIRLDRTLGFSILALGDLPVSEAKGLENP